MLGEAGESISFLADLFQSHTGGGFQLCTHGPLLVVLRGPDAVLDWNQTGCVQGEHLTSCALFPASAWLEKYFIISKGTLSHYSSLSLLPSPGNQPLTFHSSGSTQHEQVIRMESRYAWCGMTHLAVSLGMTFSRFIFVPVMCHSTIGMWSQRNMWSSNSCCCVNNTECMYKRG